MLGSVGLGLLGVVWVVADLQRALEASEIAARHPIRGLRLDPSTATLPEWTLVPGLGPSIAGRIDEARRERRLGDLEDVPGIGPITRREAAPYLAHPATRSLDRSPAR